jgi:head-tail adaptor
MTCKTIKPKTIKVCIGSMRHKIKINIRTLTPPSADSVDFGEVLSSEKEVWSAIETSRGVEVFDGTNLIGVATHLFYIRALTGQTAEDWVEFKGDYYDILDVQNFQEDDRFQVLRCNLKGSTSNPVNLA